MNGNELGFVRSNLASAQAIFLFGEDDDAAAFGSFVGEAGKLGGVGQFGGVHTIDGKELDSLPIAQRDGAGLIEQQGIDVACSFDGFAAHGEHVVLHDAIHARDADGGKQAADGGRDQADQQRDEHRNTGRRTGSGCRDRISRERREGDHGEQEDERQARDHDVERDLVGRLLTLRAFHQRDHAVEKSFAGIRGDLDLDVIREHFGAAGDGAAIAAGFADDRRAFAGDDGFVHAGDAFDDVAIAGDDVVRFAEHDVAFAQGRGRSQFDFAVAVGEFLGLRFGLGLAQAIGLGFAAAFRHGFGEVGEQHGEPEPQADLHLEAEDRRRR